jgi:hypothetical protein
MILDRDLVIADLAASCPSLAVASSDLGLTVIGGFPIIDQAGKELTRFSIRIEVPSEFPDELPVVFETAFRIPRTAGRHTNPDGSCCVGVPAAIHLRLGKTYRLSQFILGPMKDYFIGQALVERGDPWPVGEADHGIEGVYKFWKAHLRIKTGEQIANLLIFAASMRTPRKNGRCPCGLRKRARICHRREIRWLQDRFTPGFLIEQSRLFRP